MLVYNLAGSQTPGYIIGGTGSVIKSGSGTLTFNNAQGYTGGTIVNGGTLALGYNDGGATGTLQGSLTINPGGTAFPSLNNALGYGGSNWVQTININGGVLSTGVATDNGWGTTITMTAGTMGTTVASGYFAMGTEQLRVASHFQYHGDQRVVGYQRKPDRPQRQRQRRHHVRRQRGSAVSDLIVTGNILTTGGNTGITLNGNGITVLTRGANTYQAR